MLRCEHCGAYIPEKGVFCPRCGEKVTPPEGKRKTAAGKWFRRMLGKCSTYGCDLCLCLRRHNPCHFVWNYIYCRDPDYHLDVHAA